MNNLAGCYFNLGRLQECLDIQKAIYKMTAKKLGNSHEETIVAGRNLALAYSRLDQFTEAKSLLRELMPISRGLENLYIRRQYALAFVKDPSVSTADFREGVATLTSVEAATRRLLGANHPQARKSKNVLELAQEALAAREDLGI